MTNVSGTNPAANHDSYAGKLRGVVDAARKDPAKLDKAIGILRDEPQKIVDGADYVTRNVDTLQKAAKFTEDHGTIANIGTKLLGGVGGLLGGKVGDASEKAKLGVDLVKKHPEAVRKGLQFAEDHPDVVKGVAGKLAEHHDAAATAAEYLRDHDGLVDGAIGVLDKLGV